MTKASATAADARTVPTPTSTASRRRSFFRPDLEGLRAVAVVLVMSNHVFAAPTGGFIGVDVFFVLSGYLITDLLLREFDRTGGISLLDFYVRRAKRIMPAATLVTLVTLLASFGVYFQDRASKVASDGLASLLFVQNWHLIRSATSYFADDGSSSPLQHFWSLSVEEQFYIFWPWVLILLGALCLRFKRNVRAPLISVVSATCLASFGWSIYETATKPGWSYFSIESRAWELAVGALLALAAPTLLPFVRRAGFALFPFGLAVIIASGFWLSPTLPLPGPWALVPVLGTVLVIASGLSGQTTSMFVLSNPVIRYIGKISFSLYLWHFPSFILFHAVFPHSAWIAALVSLAVTFVLSALTYRFVEQPFKRIRGGQVWSALLRARWLPRSKALAVVGSVAILALCAFQMKGPAWLVTGSTATESSRLAPTPPYSDADHLAHAVDAAVRSASWPSLTPGLATVSSADAAAFSYQSHGCLNDPVGLTGAALRSKSAQCAFGPADAQHTVVVFGDSIAISWMPAIVGALVPKGWRVIGIGLESCPAVDVRVQERLGRSVFPAACAARRSDALAYIAKIRPQLVVLSSAMGAITGQLEHASAEAAASALAVATTKTVNAVHTSATRVAVLTSPPESTAPANCAVRLAGPSTCLSSPSSWWIHKLEAERRGLSDTGLPKSEAALIDTHAWFCTEQGVCPAFVGSALVKADNGHLTTQYSTNLSTIVGAALEGLER